MPQPARVTAIVVNWNGGQMLTDSLASLFAQTWADLEVIVVDNGSKDGSLDAAIARFGDRLRVIRNARNEGFARGNNQAFAIATGEWVFLLNNDAVAAPDAIERLMACSTRALAVWRSSARCVSLNSSAFWIAITAWSAKVRSSESSFSVNRFGG